VSTNQADSRANQDAIEVAIPTNAAVSSIAQWITYPAVELCRCCFGTATASDACGACHGRTVMSGRRTVQVQLPPGLRDGQLLILPGLVDHYPDRQDDLCMRIRLLPPAPDELWWATKGASRRSPAGSGLPRVLAGPFETNFPDRRLLSCRLVGGYGHNLRPDLPYTLSVGQRAFAMTTEHSRPGRGGGWGDQRPVPPLPLSFACTIPFRQLTDFQVWGPGAVTRGGGFSGGGYGLEAAAIGILTATALNAMTTQTTITSYLTIRCQQQELTFLYAGATPHALKLGLAHVFGALRQAARAEVADSRPPPVDPVDRLGKLGQLHAQGMLTDEEFDAAKQKLLGAL
jgi:hypothetical protein